MLKVALRKVEKFALSMMVLDYNMYTVGFWCQTIHKKFLWRFDTIFGLKMMMKSGLEKIILKFHDGLQSCCCPERLNWPGRLAGISEGHHEISKYFFLDHFSSSF